MIFEIFFNGNNSKLFLPKCSAETNSNNWKRISRWNSKISSLEWSHPWLSSVDNSQPNIPIYYVTCWKIHSVVDKEISNSTTYYTRQMGLCAAGEWRSRQMKTFTRGNLWKKSRVDKKYFIISIFFSFSFKRKLEYFSN